MAKFKIDLRTHSITFPFGLFVARSRLFWMGWVEVQSFETREEAKAWHEKIKDLPEYL